VYERFEPKDDDAAKVARQSNWDSDLPCWLWNLCASR